jgi:hypothetical protein
MPNAPDAAPPAPLLPLARAARFTYAEVPREQIKNAVYNPRFMDAYAKKRLRTHLESVGLVEPLIWNKRTGNLVGGHQRLSQLDAIEESVAYRVPVAVVDLDPKAERELNVWLNNPSVQGQYDMARLELLFSADFGASPFEAGFERVELEMMFSPAQVEDFVARYQPDVAAAAAAHADAVSAAHAEDPDGEDDGEGGGASSGGTGSMAPAQDVVDQVADEAARIKAMRKEWKGGAREDTRQDHIAVIVFDTAGECDEWLRTIGLDRSQTFHHAGRLLAALEAWKRGEALTPEQIAALDLAAAVAGVGAPLQPPAAAEGAEP